MNSLRSEPVSDDLDEDGFRKERVALIGLSAADKATLGRALAERLNRPFVDLDHEIEKRRNMPVASLYDLYGQSGVARLERMCLEDLVCRSTSVVVAVGNGPVAEPSTFERLLETCFTVWLSEPAENAANVVPVLEPLYRRADAKAPSGPADQCLEQLLKLISVETFD